MAHEIISKEFHLLLNNENYLAKLILSDNIKITLIKKDIISSLMFNTDLTLDDLGKLNKIFKLYETLEEDYKILEQLFLKEKVILKIVNETISFEFKMNSPIGEEINVLIPLHKGNMNEKEINNRLYDEINELKTRVKILEKENENLKKIFELLQKLVKKIIIDSNIICKLEEINFFESMISNKFPKKITKMNLLYRASRDGDEVSTFHSKCDNKSQIIVLYQTTKDIKFGGYTSIGFDSSNQWKKDLNSFIFHIDKEKIYNAKGDQHIACFGSNGPTFGGQNPRGVAIYLYDYVLNIFSNKKDGHRTNKIVTTFEGVNNFELTNGDGEFFNIKELEVFQINFI